MFGRAVVKCGQGILVALHSICGIFPQRSRVVFLSRQSNVAPLDFLLLAEQIQKDHPNYSTVILAKTLDNKLSYLFHMVRQVYYLATSKAAVLDSYCIAVSMLAGRLSIPVMQMWHALGLMKRAGYAALEDPDGRDAETADLFHMHEGYTSVVVSSANFRDDFARTFNVDASIVYEAPLPRVDRLLDDQERSKKRRMLEKKYPQLARAKTIVYCPTFRKAYTESDRRAVLRLVDACCEAGFNFVYKPHPVSTLEISDSRIVQDELLNADLLYAADYVITDYSTIMYEAGLMGLPVFLYAYDWEEYNSRRGFELDLKDEVPAFFSEEPEAIVHAISENEFDQETFSAFVERYISVPENESCTQRVEQHLFGLIAQSENGDSHEG